MIIVKIYGGLGNQMFQYALGRTLSLKNKAQLKLELSFFNNSGMAIAREYGLNHFNIEGEPATIDDLWQFTNRGFSRKVSERLKPFYRRQIVNEPHYNFAPNILKIIGDKFLSGYWQSEKYFLPIADIIRRDFTLRDEYKNLPTELVNKIKNSNSISIHFRRGDYVASPEVNKVIGVKTLDYYYQALSVVAQKVDRPHLFIFSDDIEWVRNNFKTTHEITFISGSGLKDYQEMILMSLCQHNILANSSFSWWGAWLNNNPNKIVIAPKKWLNDSAVNTQDLIPDNWIKL